MALGAMIGLACTRAKGDAAGFPVPAVDVPMTTAEPGTTRASAVLAGGCFWCTEAVFEQIPGVLDVVSGYAGDSAETAKYDIVKTGRTKHAEAIRIEYDPAVVSFGKLLKVFFSIAHDPTQLNRQGGDIGPQYRSAIFYASETERDVSAAYIKQLNEAGVFPDPIVTTLEKLEAFYIAEDYHQDYARINPDQPYVAHAALPKRDKAKKLAEKMKAEQAEKDASAGTEMTAEQGADGAEAGTQPDAGAKE